MTPHGLHDGANAPQMSSAVSRMPEWFDLDVRCAAESTMSVLITAPPSIADAIAGLIHRRSQRSSTPMVTVECGTVVPHLEAQIRGSLKAPGTVFLRNIDALTPAMQTCVRQCLATRAARVISSSSGSLTSAVHEGRFDEMLFYQLNHIHITSPVASL